MILLALDASVAILMAGVSSMNNGISRIDLDTFTKLSKSDSDKLPLLISFELIFACSERILVANCSADISNEKNATFESVSPLS